MSRNQDAKTRRQQKSSIRPGLEQLESRLVPAKVVTTPAGVTRRILRSSKTSRSLLDPISRPRGMLK